MIDLKLEECVGGKYRIRKEGGDFWPSQIATLLFPKDQAHQIKSVIEAAYKAGQNDIRSGIRHLIDVPSNESVDDRFDVC